MTMRTVVVGPLPEELAALIEAVRSTSAGPTTTACRTEGCTAASRSRRGFGTAAFVVEIVSPDVEGD